MKEAARMKCHGQAAYIQHENGTITIKLRGRIAKNLQSAAMTLNAVKWLDKKYHAVDILCDFAVGDFISRWGESEPHHFLCGISDEINGIADSIDTIAENAEIDEKRRDELRQKLQHAFNVTREGAAE